MNDREKGKETRRRGERETEGEKKIDLLISTINTLKSNIYEADPKETLLNQRRSEGDRFIFCEKPDIMFDRSKHLTFSFCCNVRLFHRATFQIYLCSNIHPQDIKSLQQQVVAYSRATKR